MIARTEEQKAGVIEAGRRFGIILEKVAAAVAPGVSTAELNKLAESLILQGGDVPSFKGYRPEGAPFPFPAGLCISVNDEVVHGIPSADRVLKEGDIVSLDLGLTHKGYIMDSAITVPVGKVSFELQNLMATTDASLAAGIEAARPGNKIGDISNAIESTFKGTKFSIVKVLGGHGVGEEVHEEPFISNTGHAGTGPEILPGMVLAIEPIATLGKAAIIMGADGYTYHTRDGSFAAHFEHTILVGNDETLILTKRPSEK
jgi:methionyl aminopeptidase